MKGEPLTQYNQCLYKKERTKTEGEYHLMKEVEIGVDLAAKKCQGWMAISRSLAEARKNFALQISEGAWPCFMEI